jgi:hypothetical protein
MNDKTPPHPPHTFREGPLQKGRDDQIRAKERYRFFRNRVVDVEFNRHLVAAFSQIQVKSLRQAIKGVA